MLNIQDVVSFFQKAFFTACQNLDILPIFHEAASGEGDEDGGATYHGWAPIGLPGAKFHAMTGQCENTNLVRQARAAGKALTSQVIGRPDYYDSFAKFNSFKM